MSSPTNDFFVHSTRLKERKRERKIRGVLFEQGRENIIGSGRGRTLRHPKSTRAGAQGAVMWLAQGAMALYGCLNPNRSYSAPNS
jgi:hypothetical protein